MRTDNLIQQKSFAFAIRIVNAYSFLINDKKEFIYRNKCFAAVLRQELMRKKLSEANQKPILFQSFP